MFVPEQVTPRGRDVVPTGEICRALQSRDRSGEQVIPGLRSPPGDFSTQRRRIELDERGLELGCEVGKVQLTSEPQTLGGLPEGQRAHHLCDESRALQVAGWRRCQQFAEGDFASWRVERAEHAGPGCEYPGGCDRGNTERPLQRIVP